MLIMGFRGPTHQVDAHRDRYRCGRACLQAVVSPDQLRRGRLTQMVLGDLSR